MSELSQIAVNILRDVKRLDPEAFASLVAFRTKANEKLAAHPNIQVSAGRSSQVGIIGILNGILTAAGQPKIAAIVDNDTIVGFTVLEQDSVLRTLPAIDGSETYTISREAESSESEKA